MVNRELFVIVKKCEVACYSLGLVIVITVPDFKSAEL